MAAVAEEKGVQEVKALTAKEVKVLAKPEFAAQPDLFYPTDTVRRFGFSRATCSCGHNYWRHSEKQTTCGDSSCVGRYTFIGKKTGIGKDHHVGYGEAWETLKTSLENARIPHTAIKRYPVVARWRQDVDYVAAGIFCFQPFCVTGELDPPANPLCCPQFCLRFNDLDSIGLTGRHYSGFIMLGIQVFNKPQHWVYFKEECVEFNLNWLINGLKIDPDEITLIEDVWAGGGNLGPSMEYFVGGLELGNMVFMQYKVFPDGSREELQVKVIDVGIGLERVPWLLNGSPTSYVDVFPHSLKILQDAIGVGYTNPTWEKFGPLSCVLNADEVDNMDEAWKRVAAMIDMDVVTLKHDIQTVRDLYIVADHTRTVMIAIEDGSLPSNTGGAANLRNVLRRVFAVLHRNKWWDKLGMDGLLAVFEAHRKEMEPIYGPFAPYPSFDQIIKVEYERWLNTDAESKKKLEALLKKKKGVLTTDDWIMVMSTYGLDADKISEITGLEQPATLYAELAQMQERTARQALRQLYDTVHLPPTYEAFYELPTRFEFDATVVAVFNNVQQDNVPNIVILDRTNFYPLGGGQDNDTGSMVIDGKKYQVTHVTKVGKAILHVLNEPVADPRGIVGSSVHGIVNKDRRIALRNHHTATHVLSAACRAVLGPHVWQDGAKKTEHQAHLDITHFRGLTAKEEQQIENECNRIARQAVDIHKYEMPKEKAELQFGFSLYQGGVVPGSTLRIVDIAGVDQEACCGTHCDNTAEIGFVRILSSNRISDGVVRIYFVAGDRAIEQTNKEADILGEIREKFSVQLPQIVPTVSRFFQAFKENRKNQTEVGRLTLKAAALELIQRPENVGYLLSSEESPTVYISHMPSFVQLLKNAKKALVIVGDTFVYGMCGAPDLLNVDEVRAAVIDETAAAAAGAKKPTLMVNTEVSTEVKGVKGKVKVGGVLQFQSFSLANKPALLKVLAAAGAVEMSP